VSSHAYTILDIQEVFIVTKKEKKKKERILKLQNPWGKYEWKGNQLFTQVDGAITLMFGAKS